MLTAVVPDDRTVPYEHRMITGDPADEIVALAEEEKADLIVMGTHGRTGLGRLLMGAWPRPWYGAPRAPSSRSKRRNRRSAAHLARAPCSVDPALRCPL